MKVLVTGTAGFIGSSLAMHLLERGDSVVGIDNHNDYYDLQLKEDRLNRFIEHQNYEHFRLDINEKEISEVCQTFKPDVMVNLAAQAGVQYSLENPKAYIESNIMGFLNLLEIAKNQNLKNFVYASSSSVYGANTKMPFSENHFVSHPLSMYATTKRSNELMAHTYSFIHSLPCTGLRFFTVYGPWGRPDMALFKFTKAILNDEPIDVYNNGKHSRDFTYIDDIVSGIISAIEHPAEPNTEWSGDSPDPSTSASPSVIYNIGNGSPINLMDFIHLIEEQLGKEAKINFLPLQVGDVPETHANIEKISNEFNYMAKTPTSLGIKNFITWYKNYYKI